MSPDMRAAAYTRISDDRAGQGLGVQRQREDCEKLIADRGWSLVEVYTDNDQSAYRGKRRDAYEQLLDAVENGLVDVIVAWHPDRLHRSPVELERFIDLIERHGITVATVQGGEYDLTTAAGRMTARVVGAVARHESEHKSERLRRKHEELAAAGKLSGGGTRPFGFEDDRVTVRPSEAVVVVEMVRRLGAGESLRGIAVDLNSRGITTTTGRPWTQVVLRRLVTSPRIAGLRQHRGEIAAVAAWPALVDRAEWEACRRLLLDPSRRPNRVARSYLLTGHLYCGLCDAKLVARPRADKTRCYVCARGPGFSGCGKIRAIAETLEDWVVAALAGAIDDGGLASARAGAGDLSDAGVAGELTTVEARLESLAEDYADGVMSRREWLAAKSRLDDRRRALEAQVTRGTQTAALGLLRGDTTADSWKALSFDQQRAVLAAAVDRITIGPAVKGRNFFDPSRVSITWRM